MLVGSLALFFIDLHRRNLARHKHTRANGTKHLCVSESCPQRKRLSFSQEPDNHHNAVITKSPQWVRNYYCGFFTYTFCFLNCQDGLGGGMGLVGASALVMGVGGTDLGLAHGLTPPGDPIVAGGDKPELTCISEEGIADMDLPDNLLDDLDYIGDCITSCNKVGSGS